MFRVCHALLKNAILLNKVANDCKHSSVTVLIHPWYSLHWCIKVCKGFCLISSQGKLFSERQLVEQFLQSLNIYARKNYFLTILRNRFCLVFFSTKVGLMFHSYSPWLLVVSQWQLYLEHLIFVLKKRKGH